MRRNLKDNHIFTEFPSALWLGKAVGSVRAMNVSCSFGGKPDLKHNICASKDVFSRCLQRRCCLLEVDKKPKVLRY